MHFMSSRLTTIPSVASHLSSNFFSTSLFIFAACDMSLESTMGKNVQFTYTHAHTHPHPHPHTHTHTYTHTHTHTLTYTLTLLKGYM